MRENTIRKLARVLLGSTLVCTGVSHLTFARQEFKAQVPNAVPLKKDDTVFYSGIAEIALGCALIFTNDAHQDNVGKIAAAFFIAVFPGNISQYLHRRDAFGLDTDRKRFARLFFQPVLIFWAWQSTRSRDVP